MLRCTIQQKLKLILPHQHAAAVLDRQEIVILGLTESGAIFRPSDWAERLCGVLSHFTDDQRIRYSPYVTPIIADGIKCVVIDRRLQVSRPDAFKYLLWFARDNALRLRAGRGEERGRFDCPMDLVLATD